jgi:hypothetical protein
MDKQKPIIALVLNNLDQDYSKTIDNNVDLVARFNMFPTGGKYGTKTDMVFAYMPDIVDELFESDLPGVDYYMVGGVYKDSTDACKKSFPNIKNHKMPLANWRSLAKSSIRAWALNFLLYKYQDYDIGVLGDLPSSASEQEQWFVDNLKSSGIIGQWTRAYGGAQVFSKVNDPDRQPPLYTSVYCETPYWTDDIIVMGYRTYRNQAPQETAMLVEYVPKEKFVIQWDGYGVQEFKMHEDGQRFISGREFYFDW